MSTEGGTLAPATENRLETFLDDWRREHEVPGASIAVVDREGIVFAAGQGASDVEARTPITPDTRVPFASVSKLVTAVSILQLVEREQLALDDEIREYVSLWTDVPGDPITVEELLTHSSGMPADHAGRRTYLFADEPPASPLLTMEDVRRHTDGTADHRIVDDDRFMYSDRGYQILGLIVEAIEDRPYAHAVAENVFEPLGMDRSTIGYGKLSELDDAITGYTVEEGVPAVSDFDLDTLGVGPPVNGVLSPVTEMSRLVRCLMNGGELDGTRVLGGELVEAMCSHQITTRETIDGARHGMGYGPRVQEFLGEPYVYHSGTVPGAARAYAGWLPDQGVGLTLGINTADNRIGVLGQALLAIMDGHDPAAVVPFLSLRQKVRSVAGTYVSARGEVTMQVEPAGSDSYIQLTRSGWEFPAFPESVAADDRDFYTVWAGGWRGSVEFHETKAGMELRINDQRLQRTHLGR